MGEYVDNKTKTENEMPTYESSLDSCVDFFGSVASARGWSEEQISDLFEKALRENPLIAMKTLFYARDVRGGQGERRVFRICLNHLCSMHPEIFRKNLHLVPEYGRWDDMFDCSDSSVLRLIKKGLDEGNSLLAKWLPRKGGFAKDVRDYLGLSPKQYRKLIVGLSNTVEQKMCANEWWEIELSHVPSVAMNKYNKAFWRHVPEKFKFFLDDVKEGKATIHADTLYPYDLYRSLRRGENPASIEAQWNALPNYMEGNKNKVFPICDTSGSMMSCSKTSLLPIDVCISLGIYISERNEGLFQDAFMTFSDRPEIQYLKGSLEERCLQLGRANWDMNTDLGASFRLLLKLAKDNNVAQDKMPDTILILSDMQFDKCVENNDNTALQMMERMYEESGYKLPQVVFWNLNARAGQSPVTVRDKRTCLVSGCSPVILKSVLDGSILTPMNVMMKVVLSERYKPVSI